MVRLFGGIPCRRKQSAQPIAAHCQALDRPAIAGIMENQDRSPPRMHIFGIKHGCHHRLFKIFTRHQQPKINALFAHDRGDDCIEPFRENAVFQLRLFTR